MGGMLLLAIGFSFLSALILVFNVYKYSYRSLVNPFFWVSLLTFAYFSLPSLFVYEINTYFDWGLTESSIHYALLVSAIVTLFFALITFFLTPDYILPRERYWAGGECTALVKIIWVGIFLYLLGVLLFKWVSGGLTMTDSYTGTEQDIYKLKSVSYLLVTVSVIAFFDRGKLFYFIPNILIVILDILAGSRTAAFIVLVPVVLSICVYYRRLFVLPIASVFALFAVVGIVRTDNVVRGVPIYLDVIAEFREVFVTLPIFIERADYVGKGDIYILISQSVTGLLQPFRQQILATIVPPGQYIYELVDRGYGLGANVLTDALYYGYFFVPLTLACFFVFCLSIFFIISKLNLPALVAVISLLVIFFRLIIREGFYFNFGLFFFVFLFYCAPVLFLNSIYFKFPRYSRRSTGERES